LDFQGAFDHISHDYLDEDEVLRGTAVAYADDVTVFLTTPTDVTELHTIFTRFEEATGAKINVRKSGALAIGTWNINLPIFNIPYKENIRILGMTVTGWTRQSADKSWATTIAKI
jgi:hypothetical protein